MGIETGRHRMLGIASFVSGSAILLAATTWTGVTSAAQPTPQEVDGSTGCYGVQSPTGSLITGEATGRRPIPTIVINGEETSGRWFGPGNRSYWHCHTGGQMQLVASGRGRVQKRGERIRNLGVGEAEYVAPFEEHWHGATPTDSVHYFGINFQPFGDLWMEPVSERDYLGSGLGLETREVWIRERGGM